MQTNPLRSNMLEDMNGAIEQIRHVARQVPAGEWLADAVKQSADPRVQDMIGEVQTLILNLVSDLAPHIVYHLKSRYPIGNQSRCTC